VEERIGIRIDNSASFVFQKKIGILRIKKNASFVFQKKIGTLRFSTGKRTDIPNEPMRIKKAGGVTRADSGRVLLLPTHPSI
jgi:hypothetical protein